MQIGARFETLVVVVAVAVVVVVVLLDQGAHTRSRTMMVFFCWFLMCFFSSMEPGIGASLCDQVRQQQLVAHCSVHHPPTHTI